MKKDADKVSAKLIKLNNNVVLKGLRKRKADSVMLILPHCLQHVDCTLKLGTDLFKCGKCGRCDIEKLASICEKYNLSVKIASGGSYALKLIKEEKPKLIVAVACERDLITGIRDIYPLHVLGITNRRPEGPCKNTKVNCSEVDDVISKIV